MKGTPNYRMTCCFTGSIILIALLFCTCAHSALLLEKSYTVRRDRGRDILCEPYTVQKNDWVLKLFKQKGELSYQDYPEFLGIFQRLNPHIHDTNTIRPGQVILIPLEKLDDASFPGQTEGIVTIPFVTTTKVSDILHQYSRKQKIKRGDTIYGIMSRQFTPMGSKAFNRGMKLFRSINPNITNLNRIFAGQIIRVPVPAIVRQPWYASLFDESGNLKTKIPLSGTPPDTQNRRVSVQEPVSDLAKAARIANARLRDKGSYYFPNPGGQDFRLDLSQFPLIELKNGRHIIFQDKEVLLKTDLDKIRHFWPDVEMMSGVPQTSFRQILDLFLSRQEGICKDNHLKFSDQGIDITVRANWITRTKPFNTYEPDRLCITLIEKPEEQTSPAIVRYLADNNILIREIVHNGKAGTTPALPESQNRKTPTPEPVVIDTPDLRTFVRYLLTALGFSYEPDISITFPYAGVQVEALSNLVSNTNRRELLVDFGDLYGDAISAIEQSGLSIIQLMPDETPDVVLPKILTALAVEFKTKPVFQAAGRPESFNTAITIPGHLIFQGEQSKTLLSMIDLNKNILRFLKERGISVIRYHSIN